MKMFGILYDDWANATSMEMLEFSMNMVSCDFSRGSELMTLVVAAYILLTYPKFILTGQSIM
jgi:hypothetical protein